MYILNEEIRSLGESVIENHAEFEHLIYPNAPCRIAYMYSDKKKTHDGRMVYADTTRMNEMLKDLTGYHFVITFYGPAVDNLPDEPLRILMYHELLHVGYNPATLTYWINPHDVEDFECIIAQYGIDWANNLQQEQEA